MHCACWKNSREASCPFFTVLCVFSRMNINYSDCSSHTRGTLQGDLGCQHLNSRSSNLPGNWLSVPEASVLLLSGLCMFSSLGCQRCSCLSFTCKTTCAFLRYMLPGSTRSISLTFLRRCLEQKCPIISLYTVSSLKSEINLHLSPRSPLFFPKQNGITYP